MGEYMKKLLLLLLLSTTSYADVFDIKITQENFYCKPAKKCNIYMDFDILIVNETAKFEHYNLGYDLELAVPFSSYGSNDKIDIPPRGSYKKHYHLNWPEFGLKDSASYLLKSNVIIEGQPQVNKTTTTTIWVY